MERTINVNKDSFRDWKANPVTKYVMNILYDRISELETELGASAGIDPLRDRYVVGAIQAYKDLTNISFEDIHND